LVFDIVSGNKQGRRVKVEDVREVYYEKFVGQEPCLQQAGYPTVRRGLRGKKVRKIKKTKFVRVSLSLRVLVAKKRKDTKARRHEPASRRLGCTKTKGKKYFKIPLLNIRKLEARLG